MPIYEFRCEACSQVFELLAMKAGEEIEAKCPHCGGEELSRMLSATNCVVSDSPSPASTSDGVQNRSCSSGNCTTVTLPGHTR
jgi:putative FmdB family regulatory protein